MKLKDFIDVLKQFPQDSEVVFTDNYEEEYDTYLFAVHHIKYSPSPYEDPKCECDSTRLLLMRDDYPDYNTIRDEETSIPTLYDTDQVWYNTIDALTVWDEEARITREVYFNPDTMKFKD